MTDEELQLKILDLARQAAEIDPTGLIERAERGAAACPPAGCTEFDMRMLATGLARFRAMIAVTRNNQIKRRTGEPIP